MRDDRRPIAGACSGAVRVRSAAEWIDHGSDCPCGVDR